MSSEKILLVVTGTMYIFASSLVLRPENEYHKSVLVIFLINSNILHYKRSRNRGVAPTFGISL
jgi:hypothetical protein